MYPGSRIYLPKILVRLLKLVQMTNVIPYSIRRDIYWRLEKAYLRCMKYGLLSRVQHRYFLAQLEMVLTREQQQLDDLNLVWLKSEGFGWRYQS
jgi:hypothetical protein